MNLRHDFLAYALIVSVCISTLTKRVDRNDSFIAIKVISEMPFDIRNDSVLYLKDEATLYKFDNYTVYEEEINSPFQTTNGTGLTKSIPFIAGEIKTRYFVSNDSLNYGVYFEPLTNKISGKIPVDSFKRKNTLLYSFDSFQTKFMDKYKFLKRTINKDDEIVNYFIVKVSGVPTMADTVCYYYTKEKSFTNVNYSFAVNSDTIKNYKLYKFIGILNQLDYPDSRTYKIRNEIKLFFYPFQSDKSIEIKSIIAQSGL